MASAPGCPLCGHPFSASPGWFCARCGCDLASTPPGLPSERVDLWRELFDTLKMFDGDGSPAAISKWRSEALYARQKKSVHAGTYPIRADFAGLQFPGESDLDPWLFGWRVRDPIREPAVLNLLSRFRANAAAEFEPWTLYPMLTLSRMVLGRVVRHGLKPADVLQRTLWLGQLASAEVAPNSTTLRLRFASSAEAEITATVNTGAFGSSHSVVARILSSRILTAGAILAQPDAVNSRAVALGYSDHASAHQSSVDFERDLEVNLPRILRYLGFDLAAVGLAHRAREAAGFPCHLPPPTESAFKLW